MTHSQDLRFAAKRGDILKLLPTKHTAARWFYFLGFVALFALVLWFAIHGNAGAETRPLPKPLQASKLTVPDPCGLTDVVCPGETPSEAVAPLAKAGKTIRATVTTYQAVPEQTDATPCSGAMPHVEFCHPSFPIVANNGLALGAKVEIRGVTYVVADRMASRFGADHFDILTSGENYRLINETVTVL